MPSYCPAPRLRPCFSQLCVAPQVTRVESLGLRHFGRSKPDLRKAGAPRGPTRAQQDAALAAAVREHVADERKYLRSARTVSNIDRAHAEFSNFLIPWRTHPSGHWATCTPEVVLYYLRTVLSQRTGRSGGELSAATLRQQVSNLSSCFIKLGREQPWDELAGCGNPVASSLVRNHVEMAERRQHAAGQRECSAVPVPIDAVTTLLRHLDGAEAAAVAQHNRLEQLRCARDAAMIALLWHSSRRGADLLRLRWHHVHDRGTDELAVLSWGADTSVAPTSGVHITLDEVKNVKRLRPLTIVVPVQSAALAHTCAVRRLQHLFRSQRQADERDQQVVFCSYRTVQPPHSALSASGFANRFDKLVSAAFVDSPAAPAYTVHGIRRGRMQFEAARGTSVAGIMQLAGLSTESVALMYLDPGRHLV